MFACIAPLKASMKVYSLDRLEPGPCNAAFIALLSVLATWRRKSSRDITLGRSLSNCRWLCSQGCHDIRWTADTSSLWFLHAGFNGFPVTFENSRKLNVFHLCFCECDISTSMSVCVLSGAVLLFSKYDELT